MPTSLSPRQLECAQLFARGLQAKDIGRRLNIQTRTVETHIEEAYRRLGVSGRPALQRALGIEYGGDPNPIPEPRTILPDHDVGGVSTTSETARSRRTFYELYEALGPWRIPPRPPGGRLTVVMVLVLITSMVLGTALLLLSAVYAVLDSLGLWN